MRALLPIWIVTLILAGCATKIDGEQDDDLELEAVGPNLLGNHGFETSLVNDRCSALDEVNCQRWGTWGLQGDGARRVTGSRDAGGFHLRLENSQIVVYAAQTVEVRGGARYRLRAWANPEASQFTGLPDSLWVNFQYLDESWETYWRDRAEVRDYQKYPDTFGWSYKDGWYKIMLDVETPPWARVAQVVIEGDSLIGPIHWDDVVFAPLQ
jgi:hypothetical protein